MNKKSEIIFVCAPFHLCNKISVRKPLVGISRIQLLCFPFNVSCKQNANLNEVFHVKSPIKVFHFCHR